MEKAIQEVEKFSKYELKMFADLRKIFDDDPKSEKNYEPLRQALKDMAKKPTGTAEAI